MTGNEIRRKFLEYFQQRGHKVVHSSPVYPPNDPTILFTNAGMNQFKDVFLGNERREYTRAVSSQKCIRAGGKHNDLDEVGKTARHHTFFEMLGNFSFGDYFKADAIKFAWDFLTGSKDEGKLGLDPAHLWFTYFEGDAQVSADTEARDLWIEMGAKPERVLPFGAKENFWQMGDTGPCGPCSEIHYYMDDDAENPERNRPEFVNAATGDDTIEIWNLVFMQFDRSKDADGNFVLTPLPAPSVDTGAGLERIAAVMQGVKSNYETDLIKPIVNFTAYLTKASGINHPEGKELIVEDGNFKEKSLYENFDEQKQFACRVIADHARTTAFSIADGILPGNEGRAYVLRKIMRRAIYHGREHLGFHDAFFYKVCDFVVDQMKDAYPELDVQREFISKMVRLEEERFGATMTVGLKKLDELFSNTPFEQKTNILLEISDNEFFMKLKNPSTLIGLMKGDESTVESFNNENLKKIAKEGIVNVDITEHLEAAFQDEDFQNEFNKILSNYASLFFKELAKLYDTFGTPRDLIRVKLEDDFWKTKEGLRPEFHVSISEDLFNKYFDAALQETQKQSGIGQTERKSVINPIYHTVAEKVGANKFHGYDQTHLEDSKVVALVKDDQQIDELKEGEEGLIVLGETPFYAESGGQVGDTGFLTNETSRVKVQDTFAPVKDLILHKSKIEKGSVKVGDELTATVDADKRDATRRNHTATHLVHAALREVLGTHVKQAGSVVAPQFLRFDYTHYQSLSDAEIKDIEDLVNREILKNDAVSTDIKSIEEAMESGAMALFGEKYGSQVRVLSIGEGVFSKELCGGTHVRATGDIGSFKIISDEAVASGVRRIRAITGFDAFERFREDERMIDKSLGFLKTQRDQLPNAIERLQEELKRMRRENDDLKMKIATGAVGAASSNGDEAKDVGGVKVVAKIVEGLDKSGMRHLSDTLLAKLKSGVVVLARTEDDKVSFIVRVSDDLTDRIKAGKIVQEIAPIVGGRGGGKPDMAEGGGTDATKLSDALQMSYNVIEQMLG